MSVVWAALIVVAFSAILERLRLESRAKEVGSHAGATLRVLRDPELDDDAKEHLLQRHATRLFALAGVILLGAAAALGVPLGAVWLLDAAGVASLSDVLDVLQRVDFLVAGSVLGVVAWRVFRRRGRT